jgi:hypothetical protein
MAVPRCSSVEEPRFLVPMSPFFSRTQEDRSQTSPHAIIVGFGRGPEPESSGPVGQTIRSGRRGMPRPDPKTKTDL